MGAGDFGVYTHRSGIRTVRGSKHVSIPSELVEHVDFISGLDERSLPNYDSGRVSATKTKLEPHLATNPHVLRERYGVHNAVSQSSDNKQSVTGFLGQYFHDVDVVEFFALFGFGFKHREKIDKIVGHDGVLLRCLRFLVVPCR